MLVAILIVAVLILAAVIAFALVVPARISDLHASVVACFEAIESHIEESKSADPRVTVLMAENVELRRANSQALDRVMSLTHPTYLREFRRDQVAAAQGKVRETPQYPEYDEFGGEVAPYPRDRKHFEEIMNQKSGKTAPPVAPPDADKRPTPAAS